MLGVVVVGGIYSPQPPTSRLGKAVVDGRQPRHPTVRVLEQSTVEGFVFKRHRTVRCATRQVLFTVWCASDTAALTMRALFFIVHTSGRRCSRPLRWIAVAPLSHQTVR
jgi:hypothetical protein